MVRSVAINTDQAPSEQGVEQSGNKGFRMNIRVSEIQGAAWSYVALQSRSASANVINQLLPFEHGRGMRRFSFYAASFPDCFPRSRGCWMLCPHRRLLAEWVPLGHRPKVIPVKSATRQRSSGP